MLSYIYRRVGYLARVILYLGGYGATSKKCTDFLFRRCYFLGATFSDASFVGGVIIANANLNSYNMEPEVKW